MAHPLVHPKQSAGLKELQFAIEPYMYGLQEAVYSHVRLHNAVTGEARPTGVLVSEELVRQFQTCTDLVGRFCCI